LKDRLDRLQRELVRVRTIRDRLREEAESLSQDLEDLKREYEITAEAHALANDVSDVVKQQVSERFSSLVTEALRDIFGSQMTFNVNIGVSRGLPTVDFTLLVDGVEVDPLQAQGGGVVDVLSLLLRLVFLEVTNKDIPLLLDEPLKHLSVDYLPAAMTFLEEYSKKSGRQIILVSHKPISVGKRFRVARRGDESIIEEVG